MRQDFRNEKSCRGQQRSAGGSSKREKNIFADACCLKKTIALVGNMRFSLLTTIMLLVDSHERSLPLNKIIIFLAEQLDQYCFT